MDRDTISALLLLPLALAGLGLGVLTVGVVRGGLGGGEGVGLLLCLAVPAAYFGVIIRGVRATPHRQYFGELSARVFVILAALAYVLPLLAGLILMLTWT